LIIGEYAVKSFVAATAAFKEGVVDVLVTAQSINIIFNQMHLSFRTYRLFRSRIRRGCFNVDGKG
jgi:hypothetical protein